MMTTAITMMAHNMIRLLSKGPCLMVPASAAKVARLTVLSLGTAAAIVPVPGAAAQTPSATERRLVASVDAGVSAALALLERAVNINSGTLNFAGVREVGRLFDAEFTRLGFTTRWSEGTAWGRAGHLIAERHGRGRGPRVLFIGHLDTVFELDSPFQRWERLDDS